LKGKGECALKIFRNGDYDEEHYSNRFEMDGILFEEPSVHLFSFNNPLGACPVCEGFGTTIGIDEDLVVPNTNLSVFEEAIVCWKGEKMSKWKDQLLSTAHHFDFPIHRPYYQLNERNGSFSGRATNGLRVCMPSLPIWRKNHIKYSTGSCWPGTAARPSARSAWVPGCARNRAGSGSGEIDNRSGQTAGIRPDQLF
jgi:hypothetical protein